MPTTDQLHRGAFVWLRADRLAVDHRFERPLNVRKVRQIANSFDPDAIGVLYVSKREDGSVVILDGQHRWRAILEMGWGDQRVPCHQYEGLSLQDEARLFRLYNELRTRPRPFDLFSSALVEGEPRALAIRDIVAKHGLVVDTGPGVNHVACVGALGKIHDYAGGDALDGCLTIAQRAWGSESTSFNGEVLTAIAAVLVRHGSRVDTTRLVRVLHKHKPVEMLAHARTMKAELGKIGGNVRVVGMLGQIICTIYNFRLIESQRLAWDTDQSGKAFWRPIASTPQEEVDNARTA